MTKETPEVMVIFNMKIKKVLKNVYNPITLPFTIKKLKFKALPEK